MTFPLLFFTVCFSFHTVRKEDSLARRRLISPLSCRKTPQGVTALALQPFGVCHPLTIVDRLFIAPTRQITLYKIFGSKLCSAPGSCILRCCPRCPLLLLAVVPRRLFLFPSCWASFVDGSSVLAFDSVSPRDRGLVALLWRGPRRAEQGFPRFPPPPARVFHPLVSLPLAPGVSMRLPMEFVLWAKTE